MRWCVAGAGAVGGYWAGMLAKAGEKVQVIARGAQLQTLKKAPLRLKLPAAEYEVAIEAIDSAAAEMPDVLIIAVKSHQLPAIAPELKKLVGDNTIILPVMNGIPWWYFYGQGDRRLVSVDPEGAVWESLPPRNVIGCVTNIASAAAGYGCIEVSHEGWQRIGEPDGTMSKRLENLVSVLKSAGFEVEARENIRNDIWFKLWGNAVFNPISVLTEATMGEIANDPLVLPQVKASMKEVAMVAKSLGINGMDDLEARLAISRGLGAHKTSMLQDWQKGREMEIGALLSAVVECARITDIAVPHLEMMEALLCQKQGVARAL